MTRLEYKEVLDPSSQGSIEESLLNPTDATVDDSTDSYRRWSNFPRPERTYIIQSATDSRCITLLEGQVVLAQPDGRGSSHWTCVKTNGVREGGILGFRNQASGKLLGHDGQIPGGKLRCVAEKHLLWEHMHVSPHPTVPEAYELLSEYYHGWRPVGAPSKDKNQNSSLQRMDESTSGLTAWVFIEVA